MNSIELIYFLSIYQLSNKEINNLRKIIKENNLEHIYHQSIMDRKTELNRFLDEGNIIIAKEDYRRLTIKSEALNSILKEYPNLLDNIDKEKYKNELYNILNA